MVRQFIILVLIANASDELLLSLLRESLGMKTVHHRRTAETRSFSISSVGADGGHPI
jgi:hypothetical protein